MGANSSKVWKHYIHRPQGPIWYQPATFSENLNEALDANPLGREYVLQVTGTVSERSNKNINLSTGEIEITVTSFIILNKSATPRSLYRMKQTGVMISG